MKKEAIMIGALIEIKEMEGLPLITALRGGV
ncbi:hypothetical protein LCGC14_1820370 [marine sediment metagenome]|uniref:Uncharacterized protein n=1 Tax=marine sediment metagenome TaxID=412755 RepID=A0A0F9H7A6_9ZZZZ